MTQLYEFHVKIYHSSRGMDFICDFLITEYSNQICHKYQLQYIVEFWGLPPLIPLLQCVNRLGFEICSVNSCQSEQGSWLW